jgi:dolichyl-phosphate-mannose--protein O-mannosyl transferase
MSRVTVWAAPMARTRLTPRWQGLRPDLRERLYPPMPTDRLTGWLWPILVSVLAGYIRFSHLDRPHALVFDEVYYAHDAESLLKHGVERGPQFADPAFIVHPPLGKWMIAIGEWLFGGGDKTINGVVYPSNPNGWRFSAAVVGTLAVLMLARTVRRMTRSTLLGCVAGLLLALDGLAVVQSRIATLDIFLMFWVVAAFACLVADRDWGRRRLADRLERAGTPFVDGPKIGFRPWRWLFAVCLAGAIATKWAGLFYAALFVVLAVFWDVRARRTGGAQKPRRTTVRFDALQLFGALLLVPVLYTASWGGWFATSGGYDRHWAEDASNHSEWHIGPVDLGGVGNWMPDVVRSWVHYHRDMYYFHSHLHPTKADPKYSLHPYQSHTWTWLALARPVSYYYQSPKTGDVVDGMECKAKRTVDPKTGALVPGTCSQEVLGIGTPAIWWASIPALAVMLFYWVGRRDWRAGAAFLGVLITIVGWIPSDIHKRTMFLFYALPAVPFMAIALTLCIGYAIGSARASPMRRMFGTAAAGAYLIVVLGTFVIYSYPVLTAQVVTYDHWKNDLMWFTSWI